MIWDTIWGVLSVLDLVVLAATLVYLVMRIEQEVQRERRGKAQYATGISGLHLQEQRTDRAIRPERVAQGGMAEDSQDRERGETK